MGRVLLLFLLLFSIVAFISSCSNERDGTRYDGLVLKDTITGKVYLLKHNFQDSYFVDEQYTMVSGKDTIKIFL